MARPCHGSPEPMLAEIPLQVGGRAGDPPPSAPSLHRKGSSSMKRTVGLKDPAAQDINIWLKQFSIQVFIEKIEERLSTCMVLILLLALLIRHMVRLSLSYHSCGL